MKRFLGKGLRGFSLALAAGCMAGCALEGYTGPAITLTGGFQDWSIGVELRGRTRPEPPEKSPEEQALEYAAKRLSELQPEGGGKQPVSGKQPILGH